MHTHLIMSFDTKHTLKDGYTNIHPKGQTMLNEGQLIVFNTWRAVHDGIYQ
jgi:hypothetical protein